MNCILNLENTKATQQLKEILERNDVSLHADMMCDATEIRVEAVKRNMGIAYVIKEAVKNELAKKELYEVELPIELPSIKLKLVYLTGELSKIDKKFIKEYHNNSLKSFMDLLFMAGSISSKEIEELDELIKNRKDWSD